MSLVSNNVDVSKSLESVSVKKGCGNGRCGRLSSGKKRRQLMAASAREKCKLDLAVRDADRDAAKSVAAVTAIRCLGPTVGLVIVLLSVPVVLG